MSEFQALIESNRRLTEMVESKASEIDKKVEQLESTSKSVIYSEMSKTLYLDELNGLDTNEGTSSKPIKSIAKAISMVPNGGQLTITCKSNITDLYGTANRTELDEVTVHISGNKRIYLNLNNFTFFVKTCKKSDGGAVRLGIQQKIYANYGTHILVGNGNLDIDFYSPDHAELLPHPHPAIKAFIRTENGYTKFEYVDIDGKVANLGLFSLDGWSGTRSENILNYCNLRGVGKLKIAGNGDVRNDDIHVAKRATTIEEGWVIV